MKSRLTAIAMGVILVWASVLQGQITINQGDYSYDVGTVYRSTQMSVFPPSPIDWSAFWDGSGGGKIWDFSAITFDFGFLQSTVVNANTSPRRDLFPGADRSWTPFGLQSWTYFSTPPNEVRSHGNVYVFGIGNSDTIFTVYDVPVLLTKFPITGGSNWIGESQYGYTETDSLGTVLSTTEIRDSIRWDCNAWGSIKYKNKQADAIRAKGTRMVISTTNTTDRELFVDTNFIQTIQFYTLDYPGGVTMARTEVITPTDTLEYFSCSVDNGFISGATAVTESAEPVVPDRFVLEQNSPNPFNPTTRIKYALAKSAEVKFQILNVLGQTIVSRDFGRRAPGTYELEWDGRSDDGSSLPSGVYLYRVTAGDQAQTRKMLLMK